MKRILLFTLAFPLLVTAQYKPRFENDTVFTSCGFKIYPGQTLRFGKNNDWLGFRYITVKNGISSSSLENNSVVVTEVTKYKAPANGSPSVDIKAAIVYKDGSKGTVNLSILFEQAIENRLYGADGELIVPEAFRLTKEKALASHKPVMVNDTLFASCGYMIYPGSILQFGVITGYRNRFKYLNVRTNVTDVSLEKRKLRVKKLKEFGVSVLGNTYVTIIGTLIINGKDRDEIEMHVSIDYAIEDIPGVPSELVVPDQYRGILKRDPQQELKRIQVLHEDKVISKELFEVLIKKIAG